MNNQFLIKSIIEGGFPSISIAILLIIMSILSLSSMILEIIKINRNLFNLEEAINGNPSKNTFWLNIDNYLKIENISKAKKLHDEYFIKSITPKNNIPMTILATVGVNAPYIGLLGTVIGIYGALSKISESTVSLSSIASPIGEALGMTALGLMVAVPAVIGYNFISSSQSKLHKLALTYFSHKKNIKKGFIKNNRELNEAILKINKLKRIVKWA